MSKQTYSVCFCLKRRFRLKVVEVPSDIKELFASYSENGLMNVDHLHRFLKEVQGEEKLTKEDAEALMESFLNEHKHLHIFQRRSLYIKEFCRFLLSGINSPLPFPPKVHQDMSCPLSHYFIYTGHNSYLTGNQISSDSSEEPIIEALKRGVRVVELDMWPNPTKDDVHIMHGGTLTSPVKLIKCLKAIQENAFVASDYPVIITLEDHLNPELQARVAKMVHETFQDLLVCSASDTFEDFPSPQSLKRRVVISTKPPKEYLETKASKEGEDGSVRVYKASEEEVWGREISDLAVKLERKEDDAEYEDEKDESHSLQQDTSLEYKNLIAIRAEKMKGGIKAWLRVNSKKAHRVSLNEEKLEKAVLTHGAEIVRFNQRNLMRVYPKATRLDSSNFNPLIGWMYGVQMVAFNMQSHGRLLWLMQGMFRANGGCGYVKKPDFLLKNEPSGEVFDPKRNLPVKKTLKVKVYFGEGWNLDFHHTHFDFFSPPDFYVKVRIKGPNVYAREEKGNFDVPNFSLKRIGGVKIDMNQQVESSLFKMQIGIAGVPGDSTMRKTKIIQDNWTPAWNEEFEFPLTVPELALLRVEVHEFDISDKDDFGGQTCLPVWELKTGIRAVPLHDSKGDKYRSVRLLMRFDFV